MACCHSVLWLGVCGGERVEFLDALAYSHLQCSLNMLLFACLPPAVPSQVSRAAPRTLVLPPSLQPLAAGQWLLNSIQHSQEHQQQQQPQAVFRSWKYRDPAVLTQQGLEASVRQVRVCVYVCVWVCVVWHTKPGFARGSWG